MEIASKPVDKYLVMSFIFDTSMQTVSPNIIILANSSNSNAIV